MAAARECETGACPRKESRTACTAIHMDVLDTPETVRCVIVLQATSPLVHVVTFLSSWMGMYCPTRGTFPLGAADGPGDDNGPS